MTADTDEQTSHGTTHNGVRMLMISDELCLKCCCCTGASTMTQACVPRKGCSCAIMLHGSATSDLPAKWPSRFNLAL